MMSGMFDPREPLFMDLSIPIYLKNIYEHMGTFQNILRFRNLKIWEIEKVELFGKSGAIKIVNRF